MFLLAACGGGERTVHLVRVTPEADPACGLAPNDAQLMLVTALGDFPRTTGTSEPIELGGGGELSIDGFPAATRVLQVEVLTGGTPLVGRTMPFAIEDLEDGAELPVFMAPERGFCQTGAAEGIARDRPLAARAGAGVLIAGGRDGTEPVTLVERYDPATGALEPLGGALYNGLTGATMTAVDDGRVLVAGGAARYQIYDPASGELEPAGELPAVRAWHAAAPLPGGRVLLAGGCGQLMTDGACAPATALLTTSVVDLDDGEVRDGPPLARARIGGVALAEPDGRVLLVGGRDEVDTPVAIGERIDPGLLLPAEEVVVAGGLAVRLDSGASLVALAADGAAADDAAVIPPGGLTAVAAVAAPAPRTGATLTALEDGRVLVHGGLDGSAGEEALIWDPDPGRFDPLDQPQAPPPRDGHAAVLLDDGTVLLVGGHDPAGEARSDAWIFRPELTGPFTDQVVIAFGGTDALSLVPSDPSRVRRESAPGRLVVTAGGSGGGLPADWVVVGGLRFAAVALTARVRADTGAAVLLGFVHEREHAAVVLAPGQRTRLYRRLGGEALIVDGCDGQVIDAADLSAAAGVDLTVESRGDSVRASLAGRQVLTCTGIEPLDRGRIGLGPVGPAGSELTLFALSATR